MGETSFCLLLEFGQLFLINAEPMGTDLPVGKRLSIAEVEMKRHFFRVIQTFCLYHVQLKAINGPKRGRSVLSVN
jgi:hypothetical protein